MIKKKLEDIIESDLQYLIDNKIIEKKTLDYKAEFFSKYLKKNLILYFFKELNCYFPPSIHHSLFRGIHKR